MKLIPKKNPCQPNLPSPQRNFTVWLMVTYHKSKYNKFCCSTNLKNLKSTRWRWSRWIRAFYGLFLCVKSWLSCHFPHSGVLACYSGFPWFLKGTDHSFSIHFISLPDWYHASKTFLHKKMVFEFLSFDPRLHHNLPQRLWQCALPNPQTVCIRLLPHAPQGSPVSCLEFLLTHAFISKLIRILKWNGLRISSRSKVGMQ